MKILLILALITASFVFFGQFPEYDMLISSWFYDGTWLGQGGVLGLLREIYFQGSRILPLILIAILTFHSRAGLEAPRKVYGFILAYFVLAPILFTNLILKEYWGRARPRDISEFGGSLEFTPVSIFPVDQCAHNCSFVSGEASGAMAIIMVGLMLWPRAYWLILLFAPMAIMRVLAGAHFASDVILAVLFMWLFFEILSAIFIRNQAEFRAGQKVKRDVFRILGNWRAR